MIYVITVDGEVDQIVETKKLAEKEARDLREYGRVRIHKFDSWNAAEDWADLKRNLTF